MKSVNFKTQLQSACMKLAILLLFMDMPFLVEAEEISASLMEKGLQSLSLMDFSAASRDFSEETSKAKPGSPEWETAALGYAVCLHRRQPDRESDKTEAAKLYGQIIAGKSGSMNYQLALLFSGELAARSDYFGDKPEQEKAIERYNTLIDNFPKSPLAPYAALYRAQTKAFLKSQTRSREAVDELHAWLKQNPNNPIASVHWLFISDVLYYPLEDFGASLRALLEGEAAGLPTGIQKDPQLMLGTFPVDDPQALRNPRRDTTYVTSGVNSAGNLSGGSRDIQWGWNPVGGASLNDAGLTPNYLVATTFVGTVTIT